MLSMPPDTQRAFAIAWVALANRASVADEQIVADLAGRTESLQAIEGHAESLRRVQVQVEAMLRGNRAIDAALLYRDTLRAEPRWSEGHFNLGLLYGDLELYPEAITEMRRYLYLTPNAEDARAVQDKIYEWEAAMAAPAASN